MNFYTKTLCILASSLLLSTSSIVAKEKSALEIIDKALHYTESMDKYAFDAKIVEYDVKEDGSIVPYYYDTVVKVERPNKLHVRTKSKLLHRSHYFNNGLYTMMDYSDMHYGQFKVPKNIDKALDAVLKHFDVKAPLASLVYSDMEKRIKFKSSHYFGEVKKEGVLCDYIAFIGKHREVHVWVTKEIVPRIKSYETIDTRRVPHKKVYTHISWIKNPKITEKDFHFVAPKGAKKVSLERTEEE